MRKLNIAENIRAYRKARGLTQERLAEMMCVTVGAVSKWESGASVPELNLIVNMAELFEISVDRLLGYDLRANSASEAVQRILALRNEKHFDEAMVEAEKALEKFPNQFDVAVASAVLYSVCGVERQSDKCHRRALALFERALELIGQNDDPRINEWSIRNHMAAVNVCLKQTDCALEIMKKNNVEGLNDISIGYMLAAGQQRAEEALPYLSSGLINNISSRLNAVKGYAAAYERLHKPEEAYAVTQWMCADLEGLRVPGKITYLDRIEAQLQTDCAKYAAHMGDMSAARRALASAIKLSRAFDENPVFHFADARFQHDGTYHGFDNFGETALKGVLSSIEGDEEKKDALLQIWEELI